MPTPSYTKAPTTHNWVSSMDAVQNLHKPVIDPKITRRYGNQNMTGFLEMQGAMNGVPAIQFTHYEDDWLHTIVKVNAHAAGAANSTVTLTVQPTYQYTYSTTPQTPYIVTGSTANNPPVTSNPIRQWDIVQFPGGVQGVVSAVTAGTFDITPSVLGQAIPQVTSSTELIIVGNTWGEQTGQPESRNSRTNRYTNSCMIIKAKHSVSGTEMGQQIWFEVKSPNGQSGYLWYFEGQMREYTRFLNEVEIINIVGQPITNTTLANLAPTSTITEGLIPFITNNGNNYQYSGLGITRSDFEIMIRTQLDKNRGAKENTLWEGIAFTQGMDLWIGNELKNGGISYGAFSGDQKKAVDFGFDSFKLSGYTFHRKTYDVFNYPQMLGAAGQGYNTLGLVIPTDKVAASFMENNKMKETVPSMRLNYVQSGNGYSRLMEEWLTGAANGIYNGETDEQNINWRTHRGIECFSPNRYVRMYQ